MKYKDKIPMVALMLGDIEGSPYYPLFTEEQYNQFLLMSKGDVNGAVVSAAISASFIVSSESTREVIGDLSISKSTGSNYLKALDYLIKNTNKQIPAGLMPWVGGLGERNKLLDFQLCDSHGRCGAERVGHRHHKHKDPLHEVIVEVHHNRVEIDKNSESIAESKVAIEVIKTSTDSNTQDITSLDKRLSSAEVVGQTNDSNIKAVVTKVDTLTTETSKLSDRVTFLEGDRLITLERITDIEGRVKYVEVDYLYGGNDGYSGQTEGNGDQEPVT